MFVCQPINDQNRRRSKCGDEAGKRHIRCVGNQLHLQMEVNEVDFAGVVGYPSQDINGNKTLLIAANHERFYKYKALRVASSRSNEILTILTSV